MQYAPTIFTTMLSFLRGNATQVSQLVA